MFKRFSVPNTEGLNKEDYFKYCHEQTVEWQEGVSHNWYINPNAQYVEVEGTMPDFTEIPMPEPDPDLTNL